MDQRAKDILAKYGVKNNEADEILAKYGVERPNAAPQSTADGCGEDIPDGRQDEPVPRRHQERALLYQRDVRPHNGLHSYKPVQLPCTRGRRTLHNHCRKRQERGDCTRFCRRNRETQNYTISTYQLQIQEKKITFAQHFVWNIPYISRHPNRIINWKMII